MMITRTKLPLIEAYMQSCMSDSAHDMESSFFHEYKFKLEKMYDKFYTKRGTELAAKRKSAAESYYNALLSEVQECYSIANGR